MSQIIKPATAGTLPGTVIETITGNDGVPEAGMNHNFTIVTANATPQFKGSSGTETLDFGLSNLLLGASGSAITSGTHNTGFGQGNLAFLTSGTDNTIIGTNSANILTTGSGNNVVGADAFQHAVGASSNNIMGHLGGVAITSGSSNTLIGDGTGGSLTTGNFNTFFGANTGTVLITGSDNILIGYSSGSNYTGAESNNILFNNQGVLGESNVTRIGVTQTSCYISGIAGVTTSNSQMVTVNTTGPHSGQLGSASIPSIQVVPVTIPGAYPYTTLSTDYAIFVNSSAGAHTINLIASPATGATYRIKDATGNAAAHNITVTPNAGNIDGASSFVMSSNYESIDIIYSGTQWNIF